jgi:cobalt-zinc-cadmium efflux system membrane fusion protein
LTVTLTLALALAACGPAHQAAPAAVMFTVDHGLLSVPAGSPLRAHLAVQPVDAAGGAAVLSTPAAVEADPARVANILAPLTGRVLALKVRLGQHVLRGQPLLVLASGDFAQATADEAKARDALDLSRKALQRARGVQAAGGSATKDVEAAQSSYTQAEAELTRARHRMVSLSGAPNNAGAGPDLVLRAPQNGVVTTLAIASGAVVSDPTATLMTVANLDRVFVTANVAEDGIGRIGPGTEADMVLTNDPGQPLHGRVSEIDAVVQPDTRRQKVRIAVPNPGGRLMPNMYATVRFAVPTRDGVYVPQSALLMNNDTTSVLVEVRPWVFERRAVQIGDETDVAARVLSGLKPGDRIVVRGGVLLND